MYGNSSESVVVLNRGVTFTPAQATSVEMQLAENKARNREEICSLMCLPVSIITGKATVEEFTQAVKVAVLPLLDDFTKALNRAALLESEKDHLHFVCDTRDLQSGDVLKRYNAYTAACRAGWLSKNEIRYLEKYKPIERYIENHFGEIIGHESDIESRLADTDCTIEVLKADNRSIIDGFQDVGEQIVLIDSDYEQTIEKLLD